MVEEVGKAPVLNNSQTQVDSGVASTKDSGK